MTQAAPTATYFAYLNQGRFLIQRSTSTRQWVFYPRMLAPFTGETDLEWVEPSGLGTVFATTVMRKRAPEANLDPSIIELYEGPCMMSRVESLPAEEVKIGMRVRAKVIDGMDGKIVIFVQEERA